MVWPVLFAWIQYSHVNQLCYWAWMLHSILQTESLPSAMAEAADTHGPPFPASCFLSWGGNSVAHGFSPTNSSYSEFSNLLDITASHIAACLRSIPSVLKGLF